jgi:hypothetical protein
MHAAYAGMLSGKAAVFFPANHSPLTRDTVDGSPAADSGDEVDTGSDCEPECDSDGESNVLSYSSIQSWMSSKLVDIRSRVFVGECVNERGGDSIC